MSLNAAQMQTTLTSDVTLTINGQPDEEIDNFGTRLALCGMPDRIEWRDFNNRLTDFDLLQVTVRGGTPEEISFTLRTASGITWWKAVKLVSRANGSIIRERMTQDADHGPQTFSATREELSRAKLVLAKAKIFGIHTDMYEIYDLESRVGTRIELVWMVDGPGNPFAALWGFFRDIISGVVNVVVTVANAVATAVEGIAGWVASGVVWLVNLILSLPYVGRVINWILNFVTFLIGTIINGIIEIVTTLLTLMGLLPRPPEKLLRLCIIV